MVVRFHLGAVEVIGYLPAGRQGALAFGARRCRFDSCQAHKLVFRLLYIGKITDKAVSDCAASLILPDVSIYELIIRENKR